jgi:hypothetical protein
MRIIHVNNPMQDSETLNPQIIDGKTYYWCVNSEMTKANESFHEWWERKQEEMEYRSKGEKLVEGIFLYNIEGVGGIIPNENTGKYPWGLIIRYAWIKINKDNG